jgi:predicted nucleic acid-binding protein
VIFLDANVFLRHLTPPSAEADENRKTIARALFDGLATGELVATTSEVAIHEVCFVLGSPRQYGRSPAEIIPAMMALLQLPGFRFPQGDQEIYLHALDLWSQHPKLEFADSVIAARCERSGHELATFDRHFENLPFVNLWQPEPTTPEP